MRWLTSGEICKELRVTPTTIKLYCDKGKIKSSQNNCSQIFIRHRFIT